MSKHFAKAWYPSIAHDNNALHFHWNVLIEGTIEALFRISVRRVCGSIEVRKKYLTVLFQCAIRGMPNRACVVLSEGLLSA
ncbi:MAG TPA: hypothetical protein VFW11_01325 [Cyclobacteriaceae bacterium]|nr:hypothetical protein [Cyclobacteriaceae bacterium]